MARALPPILTVLSAFALPWHAGPALLALAAVAAWRPHPVWAAVGAALAWTAGGPFGAVVLAGAVTVAALGLVRPAVREQRGVAVAVLAVAVALAVKQAVAASVLPAATAVIPTLLVGGVLATGAVASARGTAGEAAGLALAGAIVLVRLAGVWSVDGVERVRAASRLGAVPLVYDELAPRGDAATLRALVLAAPGRDAAAVRLGWKEALHLGWRPAAAEPAVAVEVARRLERLGRGGEARRLLARLPREGDVDAFLALLERMQGEPVRWMGAALGPALPGRVAMDAWLTTNGAHAVEFTAREAVADLRLHVEGQAHRGAPSVRVRVDGREPRRWPVADQGTIPLGAVEAGPHRVVVEFDTDLHDGEGDRNVRLVALSG